MLLVFVAQRHSPFSGYAQHKVHSLLKFLITQHSITLGPEEPAAVRQMGPLDPSDGNQQCLTGSMLWVPLGTSGAIQEAPHILWTAAEGSQLLHPCQCHCQLSGQVQNILASKMYFNFHGGHDNYAENSICHHFPRNFRAGVDGKMQHIRVFDLNKKSLTFEAGIGWVLGASYKE